MQPAAFAGKKRREKREKRQKKKDVSEGPSSQHRKRKEITSCDHTDREFYAKGMCKNCYHKWGRNKPATCCASKKMYAKGLCQNCYMKQYGKVKRINDRKARNATVTPESSALENSFETSKSKRSKPKQRPPVIDRRPKHSE